MSGSNYPLKIAQIKADLFVAKATIEEATDTSKNRIQ